MKRISLKVKFTLLYTFFMVLLTCTALAILFSLSSREMLASVQSRLEQRVQESVENVSLRNGDIRLDSDFYSVSGDVYLSLYDENLYFLYGRLPYGFNTQPEMSDGELRTIRDGSKEWYVYDMSYRLSEENTVYIRGVTSVTDAEESFAVTVRFALILLPLMVIATAVIGYRFTKRILSPVRMMTGTVKKIRSDADLSRRVGLTEQGTGNRERWKEGKKNSGDEFYILAETFDEMLAELEDVFRREQQFTSDASHELRTPVSVILAQCDAMLEDPVLTEQQREQILLIRRKAAGMSEMVSQLLFLSRADQGRQKIQPETVDLSGLTEMIVEEQQMLADCGGRGIRLESRVQPGIEAEVDETLYIRMLSNLLNNAVRYSREQGIVEVFLEQENDEVRGKVKDYGEGIGEEELPHIWERFYRADSARAGSEHSGLGLSMVRWIVRMHGGDVSAVSGKDIGSEFVFWFPISQKTGEK